MQSELPLDREVLEGRARELEASLIPAVVGRVKVRCRGRQGRVDRIYVTRYNSDTTRAGTSAN